MSACHVRRREVRVRRALRRVTPLSASVASPRGVMALLLRLSRRGFSLAATAVAAGVAGTSRRGLGQAKRGLNGGRSRSTERGRQTQLFRAAAMLGGLVGLSGFSLFTSQAEKEKEDDVAENQKETTQEDAIILLLKKAKLSIMKGELEEAEKLLHEAARLSHQSANTAAIIYTYDTMANLAFMRGHLDQAEKLFKATMSFLLAGGMRQEDNAIIEISLKLTSIYAAQNQDKLAQAGYDFCVLTLEEKVATDTLSEEEKVNTHLLLGMTLDSYARYLLAHSQAAAAQKMYERALKISAEFQGETHPQTVVLMSDLATALDSQGLYEDAYAQARRASELAQQTEHPEAHIILNNLAGILAHKDDYPQARQVYKKALQQAEKAGDEASVRYIRKELSELSKQRKK